MERRLPWRGVWYTFWGIIIVIGISTPARGQERDRLDPISIGRVLVYPSMKVSYQRDDNLQRTNADDPFIEDVSTGIRELQPGLRFQIPFEKSVIDLSYLAVIKEYSAAAFADANGTSHYVDLNSLFQMGPSLQLGITEHLVRGTTELQEVDAGGELRFGIQGFLTHQGMATLTVDTGGIHSFEVAGSVQKTNFDNSEAKGEQLLFDLEETGLSGRYLLATLPGNQIFGALNFERLTQDRRALALQPTSYRTRSAGLGVRRKIGTTVSTEMVLSYASMDFDERGTETEPFSGLTVKGSMARRIGTGGQLGLTLGRGPRPSFFNVNSYYLNEQVRIEYVQQLGTRFRLAAKSEYQRNRYPEAVRVQAGPGEADLDLDQDGRIDAFERLEPSDGEKRRDQVRRETVSFGYDIARGVTLGVEYRRDRSNSNIRALGPDNMPIEYKIFDYSSNGYIASMKIGW